MNRNRIKNVAAGLALACALTAGRGLAAPAQGPVYECVGDACS